MLKLALVVNPSAGKGRAHKVLADVAGRLRDHGFAVDIWLSRDFAEARDLTRRAARSGAEVLAVMGGDGMMHLGVNECATVRAETGSAPALGLIPAGTGNDLCRGLGMDPDDPFAGTATIISGHRQLIDLARARSAVGETWVGTIVATGFDAWSNRRANRLAWPKGSLRYPLGVLVELAHFSPLRYRLVIDGTSRELDAMLVAVGNTAAYGGGVRICPDADARDGLLDLTIIHPVSRPTLLKLLPKTYDGSFVRASCVERLQAREVVVDGDELLGYADGEEIGSPPLTVTQVPGAIEVLVPT